MMESEKPTPPRNVDDPQRAADFAAKARAVLESSTELSLAAVEERGWTVMPQYDAVDLVSAEWVAEAANALGYGSGLAVTTAFADGPGQEPECYEFDFTQDGVLGVSFALSTRSHLLAPPDLGFAVLQVGGEYFLLAGPRGFVRHAVGMSLPTAWQLFAQIRDAQTIRPLREAMTQVMERYRRFAT